MVILLRAPLARPTAIERLVKNGESRIVYLNQLPLHAIESLPVSDHTKPTDLLLPHLPPEWVSVAFVRLCRGRHRGYSLSRPQAYCRKLAPHEGGRHPYRRAIARSQRFEDGRALSTFISRTLGRCGRNAGWSFQRVTSMSPEKLS